MLTKMPTTASTLARWGALGVATALLIGLTGSRIIAASIDNCGPSDVAAFKESQAYVPYAARRSVALSLPITSVGSAEDQPAAAGTIPSDAIGGLSRRWIVRMDTGSVYQYFFKAPIDAQLTPEEFLAQGGVQLDMDPLADGVPFWQSLQDQSPTRVTRVKIGEFDGVAVWADPVSNGMRTHNVYWSDGRYNYGLIADRPIAIAVDLARGLACGR